MPKTERGWFERKALSGKKYLAKVRGMKDCYADDCDMDWVMCYFDLLNERTQVTGHDRAKKLIEEFRSSPAEVRAEQSKSEEVVLGMAFLKAPDIEALIEYAEALSAGENVAAKWRWAA